MGIIKRIVSVAGWEHFRLVPFIGLVSLFSLGCYLDRDEVEAMTLFRDKSALYGRERKPNEPPSWPSKESLH